MDNDADNDKNDNDGIRTKSTLEQNVNRMVWLDLHEIRISSYSVEVCYQLLNEIEMCAMESKQQHYRVSIHTYMSTTENDKKKTMEFGELKAAKAIMITNTLYKICHVVRQRRVKLISLFHSFVYFEV